MLESLRDRLAEVSRRELVALCVVAVVVASGGALWYVRSLPRPVEIRTAPAARATPVPAPSPSPEPLVVHVAGEVRRPGVYTFVDGDRVVDAVRAAGGARSKADLDAINLASPLADGEQILVPRRGPTGSTASGFQGAVPGASPSSALSALVNVNTADEAQLEELPGIGPVLAQAIVDYRTENGPFPSVDSLLDVSGIGPSTLADIRELVTV